MLFECACEPRGELGNSSFVNSSMVLLATIPENAGHIYFHKRDTNMFGPVKNHLRPNGGMC